MLLAPDHSTDAPPLVLVVHDHGPDRQYLSTLCRYQGFSVIEAGDALSALTLLRQRAPDVVISGARIPPVGGYEFVRRVRGAPASAHVPIMFFSHGVHEREARAIAEICDVPDVLTPTSAPELIVDRIHALVAQARQHGTPPNRGTARNAAVGPQREEPAEPTAQTPAAPIEGPPNRSSLQLIDMVQELAAAEQQLTEVAAVAQRLTRERVEPTLLPVVVEALRTITNAEHAIGGLFEPPDAEYAERALAGADLTRVSALQSAPLAEAFRVAMQRRACLRWVGGPHEIRVFDPFGSDLRIAAGLAVPLATPARVYGWMVAFNVSGGSSFSARDEQAATIIGSQAGSAVENARLFNELQQRTHQLQTAATQTTFALEAARTGVWTWDVPSRRLHGSDALSRVLALPPSQRLDTLDDLLTLVDAPERSRVEDAFAQAVATGSALSVEFTLHRPDGRSCVLQALGQVSVDAEGPPAQMHGVLVDVTDRRLLEARLRQAQRVETVGLLAGGIAHDFNNMLTAILGYARLAEDTVAQSGGPLDEIQQIAKAAELASRLTRQLLAFSRQQVVEPSRLELNAILEDLSGMLRRLIGDDIQVSLVLDATRPAIFADRSQVEQIVMNLAVNARDAMPAGGRIEIATSVVRLASGHRLRGVSAVPGRYAVLSISDTGSGIPEQVLARIFDPFFTTKEHGRGTGLGLATVHDIVRQSGGYVDVLSGSGKGSTFLVYLPALDREGDTSSQTVEPPRGRNVEWVLLVEDETEVRRLVKTVLERAGYRVTATAGLGEAEQAFTSSQEPFDLLLTDIVMPGGTGADLYRRLAQRRPALRAIFMSGFADDELGMHASAEPGTTFLQKPFTIDRLIRCVREALDR